MPLYRLCRNQADMISSEALGKFVQDAMFVITGLIYFKLIVDFMASLAPPPKRKRRGGRWTEDERRGHD